jgi:hypothetical protein
MADLGPLLAKHAAGTLTFLDTLPLQKHDQRSVVGWLHMATGVHTKAINEDVAMSSLLHDNQSLVASQILADVVKCERDTTNQILRWGIASQEAIRHLEGVRLQIRVPKSTPKGRGSSIMAFELTQPHALDGFYMDIPCGLQGLHEERLLFETMRRIEPRFLWGMYTSVASSTGLAGSRYRLYFLGSTIPSSMLIDGRMVEEMIFQGRCLRVYGRGWFFRDKRLARLDLDATASATELASSTPASDATKQADAPTNPAKRQKPSTAATSEWVEPNRKKISHGPYPVHQAGRPWVSPNAFEALTERWAVDYELHTAQCDGVSFDTILPHFQASNADPRVPTEAEYITYSRTVKGEVAHLEVPLDTILAAVKELDEHARDDANHTQPRLQHAVRHRDFDLASLVKKGRVDTLCTHLTRHPVAFGVQLQRLYATDRPTFDLYIRQRLVHRWLRATWGGSASFDSLYARSFGHAPTHTSLVELFRTLQTSGDLEPLTATTAEGDELSLSRLDLELLLALAETTMAMHAPMLYNSDTAILMVTEYAGDIIPSYRGARSLSASTLAILLMTTKFGEEIWQRMLSLCGDDADMTRIMATLLEMHESETLDYSAIGQMALDAESRQLGLITSPRAAEAVAEVRGTGDGSDGTLQC